MAKGKKSSEKAEKSSKNTKRQRSEENEELSPTVVQEPKQSKTMPANNDMRELSAKVDIILSRLIILDEIKLAHEDFKSSLKAVELRVVTLEKKSDEVRELREEIVDLKKKNSSLSVALNNTQLIVRNLPKESCKDDASINSTIKHIFQTINVKMDVDYMEIEVKESHDKKSTMLKLEFISPMLKTRVIKAFRKLRTDTKNSQDCPLLIDKLFTLAQNHPLNGKLLTISNNLPWHSMQLLTYARDHVGTHFKYVYDTAEGVIKVNMNGKSHAVLMFGDVDWLIAEAERARGTGPGNTSNSVTPDDDNQGRTTRSQRKNNGQ